MSARVALPSALKLALTLAAAALATGVLAKAMVDVSSTWDVWYYHLPFAARIFGIAPPDVFAYHDLNEARFAGFPLLGELLQGLFWRVTGRPEAANLVAYGALVVYVVFLRRVHRVAIYLSTLALFAIPLVQAHASACYVDLPANVAAAVLVMSAYEALAQPGAVPPRLLARAALAAAVAANMRLQLNPLVAVVLAVCAVRALAPRASRRRARATLGAALCAAPLVFASPLKNLVVHGNPVYPMKITVLGVALDGPEEAYHDAPPYLADAPRAQRFVYSALEMGTRPMSDPARWTVDQWMPPASTGNRMGGFFGGLVALHVGLFGWRCARDRSRASRAAAAVMGGLTLFVANAPQSHELRYYLVWMIVLVSMNLVAAARGGRGDARSRGELALGVASLAAVAAVVVVTRGVFVVPGGYGFDALVREKVSGSTLAALREGGAAERACLVKEPWTILYASTFHPPARYRVREAETPAQCEGDRFVP